MKLEFTNDSWIPRFWSKVKIDSTKTTCWIWVGTRDHHGYGKIRNKGVSTAHGFIYEKCYGKIPKGKEIHHICNNPACVNPNHLKAVTHLENMLFTSKTHCKRGHKLNKENTYIKPNGIRECKLCRAYRWRNRK